MVIDILEHLCIDEAERGLNDSQDHIWVFTMLIFEQKNDVNYMVEDIAHFLGVHLLFEHLLVTLHLFFLNDFDEGDHFGENTQNINVKTFEVDDVKKMPQYVFNYFERIAIVAQQ